MRPGFTSFFTASLVIAGLTATSCGGDDGNDGGLADACNPLGGGTCLQPWPSMAYVKTDSSTATGFRLDLPAGGMPVNIDAVPIDPTPFNRWDGFSPSGPALVQFPTGVSGTDLPTFKDPDASLAAASPIVYLDLDTGERVPFFAEVDQNVHAVAQRALIIRTLKRLAGGDHYGIAIRKGVKAADGSELVRPEAFQALIDGASFSHPRFAKLQDGFPNLIAKMAAAGVPADDMVLAWDFVVASDDFLQSDLLTMRDAALPAIGEKGAHLTFTTVAQADVPQAYKRYIGTFKSPDFLTDGERDDSIFRRGPGGLPIQQGMRDARFAAIIPNCVNTAPLPIRTIVFGHGLFGSAEEYLDDGFVQDLAEENCFVVIAGDFIGLTSRQLQLAPFAVNDLNLAPQIGEKLGQSVIDFIALENAVRGPMAESEAFKINGNKIIDPTRTYYLGGSLGGIMGNIFMAYDPNITKGILAVPGAAWGTLFERSTAWNLLQGAMFGAYPDDALYEQLVAFLGMRLEPYDPMTTANNVIKHPLPGTPAKRILMWEGLGDCLVSNIVTEWVAREMGLETLKPSVKSPWDAPPTEGPLDNALTIYDEHPTPLPFDNNIPPPSDNGTHSGVNRNPAVLRQVSIFLDDDVIVPTCNLDDVVAPCDCTTGACE